MHGKEEISVPVLYSSVQRTSPVSQCNLTRKFEVSRSEVVGPKEACAPPVRHFLAEKICCGTFFSDDDCAITLPLWRSPSKLHLTFQPQHCWPCTGKLQRAKPSPRGRDTWQIRSSEPLLSAQSVKKTALRTKTSEALQTSLRSSRCATRTHCTLNMQRRWDSSWGQYWRQVVQSYFKEFLRSEQGKSPQTRQYTLSNMTIKSIRAHR